MAGGKFKESTCQRCIMRGMDRSPLRVVCVGECTIDCYLNLQQHFIGGISLNFAVQAKHSGAEVVSLVSRVGEDHGTEVLNRLKREGVDASHVAVQPGATATQDITVTASGERVFPPGGYRTGVLSGHFLSKSDLEFVQGHDILASALFRQIEPLFLQVMEALPFRGWRVADFLDLSDYGKDIRVVEQLGERLSIAFVSGNRETAELLRPLSRAVRCLIVVTMGAQGSLALVNGEPVHQPSIAVANVVDSTGCGDAFQAAFTVSYWRERDVRRALQRGAEQASHVIQHYGAIG
jgi:fructoselysine 6-kinase